MLLKFSDADHYVGTATQYIQVGEWVGLLSIQVQLQQFSLQYIGLEQMLQIMYSKQIYYIACNNKLRKSMKGERFESLLWS